MTPSYLPFINPATGERFGQILMATPEEARAAVSEMRQASLDWGRRPVSERCLHCLFSDRKWMSSH